MRSVPGNGAAGESWNGWPPPGRPSRRAFLARAAGAGITIAGAGSAAAACGSPPAGAGAPGAPAAGLAALLRLPPTDAFTWPITAANQPIASGLSPEPGATLRVLSWPSHVSPVALNNFARISVCAVELTTFRTAAELMTRLISRDGYDVLLGTGPSMLAELVGRQLIRPLTHSYLPNLADVWPVLADPYYDQQARYTVPYAVSTIGIAWRRDKVPTSPYPMVNGWQFPWLRAYRGRVGLLDDYRAAIGLGLLRNGTTNLNTADPLNIDQAAQVLTALTRSGGARIGAAASASLAAGRTWIHQARSGDIATLAARQPAAIPSGTLGYWFPPAGYGPVSCEAGAIARGARNPVLAHLFLNSMLTLPNALANAGFTGCTPPLNAATPNVLMSQGLLTSSLISTVVLPETLRRGLLEVPLPDPANALWLRAWKEVSGHAVTGTAAS